MVRRERLYAVGWLGWVCNMVSASHISERQKLVAPSAVLALVGISASRAGGAIWRMGTSNVGFRVEGIGCI